MWYVYFLRFSNGDNHVGSTNDLRLYEAQDADGLVQAQHDDVGRMATADVVNILRREFAPTVSTTRTGDASVSAHAKFAEIRRCSRFCPQSFQPGTPPIFTKQFQAQPQRRSCRVASTWCGITYACTVLAETDSHSSDSTIKGVQSFESCARLPFARNTSGSDRE